MTLLFLFLAFIALAAIVKVLLQIAGQQKCLSDEEIRNYMLGRLHGDDEAYYRVIGHLGNCEKCQQRMHDYKPSDNIEDHLIDDENDV